MKTSTWSKIFTRPAGILLIVLGMSVDAVHSQAKPLDMWFAPTCPHIQTDGHQTGSVDYVNAFLPGSSWPVTASKISVFKTYASFIANTPADTLHQMFKFLADHNIKIAMEFGPMNRIPGKCYFNNTAEGWGVGGAKGVLLLVNKIRVAGGVLDYIAMDEPYWNGHVHPPKDTCTVSPLEMAENAKMTVDAVHSVFPQAQFGDIEPVQPVPGANLAAEYAEWLDAWKNVMGTPLAFFHEDVLWDSVSNQTIADIGQMVRARHVPFGLIYNGYARATSSADWLGVARSRFLRYQQGNDLIPDEPVFQSWNFFPDHVMPETDPTAHTHLILEYLQHRGGE